MPEYSGFMLQPKIPWRFWLCYRVLFYSYLWTGEIVTLYLCHKTWFFSMQKFHYDIEHFYKAIMSFTVLVHKLLFDYYSSLNFALDYFKISLCDSLWCKICSSTFNPGIVSAGASSKPQIDYEVNGEVNIFTV
jgi:hypothetical protein